MPLGAKPRRRPGEMRQDEIPELGIQVDYESQRIVVDIVRLIDPPGSPDEPDARLQRRGLGFGARRTEHGEHDCTGSGTTSAAHGASVSGVSVGVSAAGNDQRDLSTAPAFL